MKTPVSTLVIAWTCLCLVPSAETRNIKRRWAERPVGYGQGGEEEHLSLHDALVADADMTYSDFAMRLTSIKDSTLRTCFITDFDPGFSLDIVEKLKLLEAQSVTRVTSPDDLMTLLNRAGPDITTMCRDKSIVWLTEIYPQPPKPPVPSFQSRPISPMSPRSGRQEFDQTSSHFKSPETIPKVENNPVAPPQHDELAPPRILPRDKAPSMMHPSDQSEHKVPPMIPSSNQSPSAEPSANEDQQNDFLIQPKLSLKNVAPPMRHQNIHITPSLFPKAPPTLFPPYIEPPKMSEVHQGILNENQAPPLINSENQAPPRVFPKGQAPPPISHAKEDTNKIGIPAPPPVSQYREIMRKSSFQGGLLDGQP